MSFESAYKKTISNEFGWVNNPNDWGLETLNGISRKYHPYWDGWKIIDGLKSSQDFPHNAYKDKKLQELQKNFYEGGYWKSNKLNMVDKISSPLAEKLFDLCVSIGSNRAIVFLQKAIWYQLGGINVDGYIGLVTLDFIKRCDIILLINTLKILEGKLRLENIDKDLKQRAFFKGHINRIFSRYV